MNIGIDFMLSQRDVAVVRQIFKMVDSAEAPECLDKAEDAIRSNWPDVDAERGGVVFDLWLWLGLKRDAPDMADGFKRRLVDGRPWLNGPTTIDDRAGRPDDRPAP